MSTPICKMQNKSCASWPKILHSWCLMALHIFSRRARRTIQHLVSPFISRPNINTPSPSSYFSSHALHYLCQTSQQTLDVHFHPVLNTPHFSTRPAISAQTLYDPIDFNEQSNHAHKPLEPGLLELFKRVKEFPSECDAVAFLDESGVTLDSELVCSAIWALRDEWRLAFLVFKWGDKLGCCNEKARSLIVWVLGSCKKFNIAWCLIRDMNRSSLDIRQAMFIMIDRWEPTFYLFIRNSVWFDCSFISIWFYSIMF